jgi:hypothetical protein
MVLTILLNYTKTRYRRFFGRKGFFDDALGGFDEMGLEKEREFEDIEKKGSSLILPLLELFAAPEGSYLLHFLQYHAVKGEW